MLLSDLSDVNVTHRQIIHICNLDDDNVDHREIHHGTTQVDNYFWLREKTNPEVIKYLGAENAYTDAMTKALKPLEDSL